MTNVNSDGKPISGAAAFARLVYTVYGGFENYNATIGTAAINEFVRQRSAEITTKNNKENNYDKFDNQK